MTNKITPEHIESIIVDETYYVFPGTTLTICLLTLKNGFHVTGESACADPANFKVGTGQRISRANAYSKIWSLEGYTLKQKLHDRITTC